MRKAMLLVAVGMPLLGGCVRSATPTQEPPPATATLTPFLPQTVTPTTEVVSVWIAPSVPPSLRQRFTERVAAAGANVAWVDVESQASVRLEPGDGTPLARWMYAVVAPFPTVEDDASWDSLREEWLGAGGAPAIIVPEDVAALLTVLLGPPGAQVVRVDRRALVEDAWAARPSRSIIPFEDLQPRWKVLAVDGRSPIRGDFTAQGYPLEIPFGLEGEEAAVGRLAQALGLAPENVERNRQPDRMTVVVMTGVTALTRATAWRMSVRGADYPAAQIGEWLREADITHVSNEVAFDPDCPEPTPDLSLLIFCSQPKHLSLLETIGTDVIELTGNHVLDAGRDALLYTLDLFDEKGWATFGGGRNLAEAREPALFEHNGNRIAFLGCNEAGPTSAWASADAPGAMPCGSDRLQADIQALKDEGYLPIFTFQWHEHYVTWPAASQREVFRAAAQAGAAIVSGSQAHQPQGFAFAGDGFIHYGLGNLFFDQMWSLAVRQEFIDRYVIYDGRVLSVELLTAVLEDWAQPRPMTPAERAAFLEMVFTASGW